MLFLVISLVTIMTVLLINTRPSLAHSTNSVSNSQPELVKILISNLTINKNPSGFIAMTGTVQNNSTEVIDHIIVNVTFIYN